MKNRKIPIIICIDAEPDGGFIDRYQPLPWKGFEDCVQAFDAWRASLEAATLAPAHFSWFIRTDPQVREAYGKSEWALTQYREFIGLFEEWGDEIGVHTHAYRWDEPGRNWVIDHGNPLWIRECVESSLDAFERVMGRPCESFRFGDRWMSAEILNLLESRGVRFDLTLEPKQPEIPSYYIDKPFTGALPATTRMPPYPYRPADFDIQTPDPLKRKGIRILPVSTAFVPPKLRRRHRLLYRFIAPSKLREQPWTLNLKFDPYVFEHVVEQSLYGLEKPFLILVLRSHVLNQDLQKVRQIKNIRENMKYLIKHPLAGKFVFATPQEAVEILEEEESRVYA